MNTYWYATAKNLPRAYGNTSAQCTSSHSLLYTDDEYPAPETGSVVRMRDLFNHIVSFMHKRVLLSVQMSLRLLYPLFYSLFSGHLGDPVVPTVGLSNLQFDLFQFSSHLAPLHLLHTGRLRRYNALANWAWT